MAAPVIILVRPQLGENIGMVARAMANFGLEKLRIVNPRDGWPNEDAVAASAGADMLLQFARIFSTVPEAIADLRHVFATTIRERGLVKPVVTADEASEMFAAWSDDDPAGILFGPERSGLDNDDVTLADTVLTIPVSPDFPSLNLAQAVGIIGYACFDRESEHAAKPGRLAKPSLHTPATKAELHLLYDHLEAELEKREYFNPPEKRPTAIQNLRNLLQRAEFSETDVRALRGIIASLSSPPK